MARGISSGFWGCTVAAQPPLAVQTAGDRRPAAAFPKPAFSAICQAVLSKTGRDGSLDGQYD